MPAKTSPRALPKTITWCRYALETRIGDALTREASVCEFVLPTSAGREIAWLHAHGDVLEEEELPAGEGGTPRHRLLVRLGPKERGQFESFGVS